MRSVGHQLATIAAVLGSLALAGPALAEPAPVGPAPVGPAPVEAVEVVAPGAAARPCPPAGAAPDYACLDRALKAAAQAGRPAPLPSAHDSAVADAQVPSKAGTFSFSAVAERMGPNLGQSAQPYRPPPPVYANPVQAGPVHASPATNTLPPPR